MRNRFMPIVGGALLAGALAVVGCVSVESTRAQLASSNPQEIQKAEKAIYDAAVYGKHGVQEFGDAERLEYVKLASDNEFLFRIIKDARDEKVIKAAAERIDLSKPGIGLEMLQKHIDLLRKVDESFIATKTGIRALDIRALDRKHIDLLRKEVGESGCSLTEKVIATLSESELLEALERRCCVGEVVERLLKVTNKQDVLCKALELSKASELSASQMVAIRLVNTTQDVSLLLSFCKGGKNAELVPYGYEEKILLKLAGMPEKLPSAVALRIVTEYRGYPVNKFLVEDVALRKGLIARLSEKDAVTFALGKLKYCSWGSDQSLDEAVTAVSAIKDQEQIGKVVLGVFKVIAEGEGKRRESGEWGKEDIDKVEALRKRLPKLGDTSIEKMLCTDEAVWPYLISDVSADVAYNLLSGKKVKSAALESELLKKLPKDRLQMIVEAKEKAFADVCEKAKAAEKETFALDGFYLGMSFDDMKVVFSHHFPKLEIKEGIDGEGKNADHVIYVPGQRSPFCYASVSDKKVYQFNFGKKLLKKWYPYDVQTPGEWARAYGREHKIDMKFRLIEKEATVYEPMDMSRSYRVWFHQESYQYRNNAKEYRLTYFGEEKDYTVHGGIGGALIKEMAAPRFRYVRGDYGSLRVKIERD